MVVTQRMMTRCLIDMKDRKETVRGQSAWFVLDSGLHN